MRSKGEDALDIFQYGNMIAIWLVPRRRRIRSTPLPNHGVATSSTTWCRRSAPSGTSRWRCRWLSRPFPSTSRSFGTLVWLRSGETESRCSTARTFRPSVRCTSGRAGSNGTGAISCRASRNARSGIDVLDFNKTRRRHKHARNDCCKRSSAGTDGHRYHPGNPRALVADGDLCRVARRDGSSQSGPRGRADADDARSVARRPLVSRPRRQQRSSLGSRSGDQDGRHCSRSAVR